MNEWDDEDEYEPAELPPARPAPRGARRRRPKMGQVMDQLGARARATPRLSDPGKLLEKRERVERGKALLQAGKNKGEQKGYGATASPEHRRRAGL